MSTCAILMNNGGILHVGDFDEFKDKLNDALAKESEWMLVEKVSGKRAIVNLASVVAIEEE